LLSLSASATAEMLLQLWSHRGSHCVTGVDPRLCKIAEISETPQAAEALRQLQVMEATFEADPMQRPAFRTLKFLATEQSLMEKNGSGRSFDSDPASVRQKTELVEGAIGAFEYAPYEALPYLPVPLLKIVGDFAWQDPARHLQMVERMELATREMRPGSDLEAVSLLNMLAMHRSSYDILGAVDMWERIRGGLADTPRDRGLKIGVLLSEASSRGGERHWDAFATADFGLEQLVQALVLMHRTPELAPAEFREYFNRAASTLSLRRSYIQRKGRWTAWAEAKAAQADAMFALLRLERPADAKLDR
jgi:hypothetical protein